jgi:hypothetical protein
MAGRHRSFNAVFYPESAPENFREMVTSWNVPALLALHDKDKEPDGEDKKPHYHLLLLFSGKKSFGQVHELVDQLGSKVVEAAYDTRGSARYLAHLDQPEKFQYGVGVIESFSGAPVADLTVPLVDPTREIIDFVREQGMVSYAALVFYCRDNREDWLNSVKGHTVFWLGLLKSADWDERTGGRGGS